MTSDHTFSQADHCAVSLAAEGEDGSEHRCPLPVVETVKMGAILGPLGEQAIEIGLCEMHKGLFHIEQGDFSLLTTTSAASIEGESDEHHDPTD